jgi:transcription elongation factor GreA
MPDQIKKQLLEEIKQLEYELITELPAEIKKARALGDLSENAEYHMAKQRQEFVNARLGQLKKRMGELSRTFRATKRDLDRRWWSTTRRRTKRLSTAW